MATSKNTRRRKPSTKATLTRKQLDSVGLSHVTIYTPGWEPKDKDDFPRFFRVPLATRFELGWEFSDEDGDGETLFAAFDGETLLKTAISLGILRETFTSERPVPKGKLPAMQIRGAA